MFFQLKYSHTLIFSEEKEIAKKDIWNQKIQFFFCFSSCFISSCLISSCFSHRVRALLLLSSLWPSHFFLRELICFCYFFIFLFFCCLLFFFCQHRFFQHFLLYVFSLLISFFFGSLSRFFFFLQKIILLISFIFENIFIFCCYF